MRIKRKDINMRSIQYIFLLIVSFAIPLLSQSNDSYLGGRKKADAFVNEHFSKSKQPPFSFSYDGKPSSSFIAQWNFSVETKKIDETRTIHVCTYTDPKTGLVVISSCTIFSDYPAVEWVIQMKNSSKANTPILEAIKAIETDFAYGKKGIYELHRARGSNAERTDFAPIDEPLDSNAEITFGPDRGRSSDEMALPFFNIETPGEGLMVGIGWSGEWKATVARNAADLIHLSIGLEKTHLTLYPDEEIRTPSILLLYWQGDDRMIGHNLLRRFILEYHTPQKDGKPVTLPFATGVGFGGPRPCNEYTCATESYAIAMINRLEQFDIESEVCWIDAGWYEGGDPSWWAGVGNWVVNKKNFPNGLRPVSDAARKTGKKFLLWFEPERVFQGTRFDREHPEWIMRLPQRQSGLFNLGNPQARRWLTDYISAFLEKEGIDLYRQDFNFDPLPFWQANDSSDRIGMTEIKYVEGLYAYWDELLARHPGLVIDNCASGGRRIDLETISRSAPLWRTDYQYYEPIGYQCHTYGINFYLPCSGTGNIDPETYKFRSSISSALVVGWDVNQSTFPLPQARKSVEEFKRLRPYFYGDYYPLTPYDISDDAWMAYQFDRPENNDGIILAFRRSSNSAPTVNIKLHGLNPHARYEISYEDYGITMTETGKELGDGFGIKIPQTPGSLLIDYHKVDN